MSENRLLTDARAREIAGIDVSITMLELLALRDGLMPSRTPEGD